MHPGAFHTYDSLYIMMEYFAVHNANTDIFVYRLMNRHGCMDSAKYLFMKPNKSNELWPIKNSKGNYKIALFLLQFCGVAKTVTAMRKSSCNRKNTYRKQRSFL